MCVGKELQKARQKYQENLRNYNHYKDQYEDHYYGDKQLSKKEIEIVTHKMGQSYDVLETLTYIFGKDVR